MNTAQKFLRFAAQCDVMAQSSRDLENKTVWSEMAERWLRCAALVDRESVSAHYGGSTKQSQKTAAHSWTH
jgi:hypothetical protein